jgi:hypothetical protein
MGTVSMKLNKENSSKKHFKNVAELLSAFDDGEIISGADGLTAGRLRELVAALK